jgi:hypothetical protein
MMGDRVRHSVTLTVQQQSELPKASPRYWRIASEFAESFLSIYFAGAPKRMRCW